MRIPLTAALLGAALLGACASDGKYNDTARDAAIGGAVGAAAGAVINDDDRTKGAVIGGAIGAAAGALYACSRDKVCPWSSGDPDMSSLTYDQSAQRSYYTYKPTGETYWENGEFRSGG